MISRNHDRYLEQAKWTRSLRSYLFSDLKITNETKVLEIGCGTGVILKDLSDRFIARYYGVDKDNASLSIARSQYPGLDLVNGFAEHLPFPDRIFNIVLCHYFLLWILEPEIVLNEIFRILQKGGVFLALAEPDYLARVDAPEALVQLGHFQNQSLKAKGCRLETGRNLPCLLSHSGFSQIRYGVSGFEMLAGENPDWLASEWETLSSDLADICTINELSDFRVKDEIAWAAGERVLWVPTFYAVGQKS